MRDPWLEEKIATTKKFGLSALAGVAVITSAFAQKEDLSKFALIFLGAMLIVNLAAGIEAGEQALEGGAEVGIFVAGIAECGMAEAKSRVWLGRDAAAAAGLGAMTAEIGVVNYIGIVLLFHFDPRWA